MNLRPIMILAAPLAASLMLGGCDSNNNDAVETTPEIQDVTIKFAAFIGDEAFECGKVYEGIGTGVGDASMLKVNDFRAFVSDIKLVKADGSMMPITLDQDDKWQRDQLALLDFEDGCAGGTPDINTVVKGNIKKDDYQGICFTLGVPFKDNHLDTASAPSPLNASGMYWSWQGGHKFLRVDGIGDPGDELHANQGYNIHLGSTGCAAADKTTAPALECSNPNTVTACFGKDDDPRFAIASDTLVFDIKPVLAESNVTIDGDAPPGCMSFPQDNACNEILPLLGLTYKFDSEQVYPPKQQSLIRMIKGDAS